jgi:hypothetical protein
MKMRPIRLLVPIALAAGLAACAQSSPITTVSEELSNTYGPDDFARQASVAPVPVIVHGRAAGLTHQQLVQAVNADIQDSTWGANTRFVSESSKVDAADTHNEFSMVIMLNGPSDVTSAQLCAEPMTKAGDAPATSGHVHLVAALCRYDATISGVEASVDGVQGAGDPKLHQLIEAAGNELTAPDPDRRKLL